MSFRNSPWSNRPREGYFIMAKDDPAPLGRSVLFCSKNLELTKNVFDDLSDDLKKICWIEDIFGQKITL